MSLGELIQAAGNLSPEERVKLVEEVTKMLRQDKMKKRFLDLNVSTFWKKKTLSALAEEQRVAPVHQLEVLAVDFWPGNESADEVIEAVYSLRNMDKRRGMC